MELTQLSELTRTKVKSLNPEEYPDTTFSLCSISAFDDGEPEIIKGSQIGSSKKILKKGDVVISRIVPHIKRVWEIPITNEKIILGSGEWIVFNSPKVYGGYLKYFLLSESFHKKFMATVKGVGGSLLRADIKQTGKIEIPLPPLSTQKKIAQILNQADALRKNTKEIIDQYDKLAQSIFLDMFGDPFNNPNNWEWTTISEITTLIKGITYSPSQKNNGGVLVLRSSNVQKGQLDLKDQVRITKKINDKFWVRKNDILMCNRNGSPQLVGKVAKIPEHQEKMTYGTFMTNIRSRYYNYLYYFFHTVAFRRQIQMQTTVAINQISLPLLERVKVPLPPEKLQNQFTDKIQSIEQQKGLAQESLRQSDDLFNTLLQKAFKGELVT